MNINLKGHKEPGRILKYELELSIPAGLFVFIDNFISRNWFNPATNLHDAYIME